MGGEQDMTKMGGLRSKLPVTFWTFLVATLALSGIFPFAGFFSKDAILAGAFGFGERFAEVPGWPHWIGGMIYGLGLLAAGCTAFYMFRLYFLVFEGKYRGGGAAVVESHGDDHDHAHAAHGHDDHGHGPAHESPPAMTVVLWILAAGSLLVGLLGIPDIVWPGHDLFGEWLSPVLPPLAHEEHLGEFVTFALIALGVSLLGIGIAWLLYADGVSTRVKRFVAAFPRLYRLVFNKYYIDEVYDFLVVRPVRYTALVLWKAFDTVVIDLLFVNGTGFIVSGFGKLSKYLQNGDLQRYIVAVIVGGAVIIGIGTHYDVWSGSKFDAQVNGRDVQVTAHGAGPTAKRLQYRVDWDGDGKYSATQMNTTFRHSYDAAGSHKISVEAIDPRWGTVSHESRTVKVQ
jgi:NADH-quinone oxidoreductase subunit L